MPTAGEGNPLAVADRLIERLDEDSLPYALGGALALGAWGVPRATSDVDIAVFVPLDDLPRLFACLERSGATFDENDARGKVASAGFFLATMDGTRIDVFLALHPWHEAMKDRRVPLSAAGGRARMFLSAEDIAIAKLIYARTKDIADLERLFALQRDRLDVSYIRHWLGQVFPPDDKRHPLLAGLIQRFCAPRT